ncbi:MAG TPA: choice-of-anchor B family protein [Bacteroidia bacterium]|nr:choice-of-anchor B family protein [Bacteroidia bacterium]
MNRLVLFLALFAFSYGKAQTYNSLNISLLSHINPNGSTVTPGWAGNWYSGCWGWFQSSTNKEYAIIGASNGTYFIDVSAPGSPSVSAFVPGKTGCTWREIKTYQNYCYVVSDDASPNTFQIIDMSPLPSTVSLVYNDKTLFERGHTIWIDQNKMYIGGMTNSVSTFPMAVYSLATPTAPVLLRELSQDVPSNLISYVHDMYVRNDTVFASAAYQGLYVLKFNSSTNTFSVLGAYQSYSASSYNHSSFLTQNGKYLMFCDEVPAGQPIRLVDVQNLSNIQPIKTFQPAPKTTPHNPYIIGNNFALVSCYHDGLFIYNISNPNLVSLAGYFDTFPQGGFQQDNYSGYQGNWGAYPFLPSGIVIANDMQNGVFILNANAAYTTNVVNPVGTAPINSLHQTLGLFPNPAQDAVHLSVPGSGEGRLQILNSLGALVFEKSLEGKTELDLDLQTYPQGLYHVLYLANNGQFQQALLKSR